MCEASYAKARNGRTSLPKLLAASADQAKFGMGITVNGMGNMMHNIPALSAMVGENMLNDSNDLSDKDADLGHGSHFARTLGFYDELAWDDAMHGNSEYDRESAESNEDRFSYNDDRFSYYEDYGSLGASLSPGKGGDNRMSDVENNGSPGGTGSPNSARLSNESLRRLSGGGYQRSPLAVGVFVATASAPGEDEDTDIVDGILGPSSPKAQRRLNEGNIGSPWGLVGILVARVCKPPT